jgi:hypothetical protein
MRFMLMFCQAAVAAFIFTLILHDASFEQIISSLRADRVTKRILTQTFVASTLISVFDLGVQVLFLFLFLSLLLLSCCANSRSGRCGMISTGDDDIRL